MNSEPYDIAPDFDRQAMRDALESERDAMMERETEKRLVVSQEITQEDVVDTIAEGTSDWDEIAVVKAKEEALDLEKLKATVEADMALMNRNPADYLRVTKAKSKAKNRKRMAKKSRRANR